MAEEQEEKKEKVEKPVKKKTTKVKKQVPPELVKKPYVLIRDRKIGETQFHKGDKIALTEEGRKYFKRENYIK